MFNSGGKSLNISEVISFIENDITAKNFLNKIVNVLYIRQIDKLLSDENGGYKRKSYIAYRKESVSKFLSIYKFQPDITLDNNLINLKNIVCAKFALKSIDQENIIRKVIIYLLCKFEVQLNDINNDLNELTYKKNNPNFQFNQDILDDIKNDKEYFGFMKGFIEPIFSVSNNTSKINGTVKINEIVARINEIENEIEMAIKNESSEEQKITINIQEAALPISNNVEGNIVPDVIQRVQTNTLYNEEEKITHENSIDYNDAELISLENLSKAKNSIQKLLFAEYVKFITLYYKYLNDENSISEDTILSTKTIVCSLLFAIKNELGLTDDEEALQYLVYIVVNQNQNNQDYDNEQYVKANFTSEQLEKINCLGKNPDKVISFVNKLQNQKGNHIPLKNDDLNEVKSFKANPKYFKGNQSYPARTSDGVIYRPIFTINYIKNTIKTHLETIETFTPLEKKCICAFASLGFLFSTVITSPWHIAFGVGTALACGTIAGSTALGASLGFFIGNRVQKFFDGKDQAKPENKPTVLTA